MPYTLLMSGILNEKSNPYELYHDALQVMIVCKLQKRRKILIRSQYLLNMHCQMMLLLYAMIISRLFKERLLKNVCRDFGFKETYLTIFNFKIVEIIIFFIIPKITFQCCGGGDQIKLCLKLNFKNFQNRLEIAFQRV